MPTKNTREVYQVKNDIPNTLTHKFCTLQSLSKCQILHVQHYFPYTNIYTQNNIQIYGDTHAYDLLTISYINCTTTKKDVSVRRNCVPAIRAALKLNICCLWRDI